LQADDAQSQDNFGSSVAVDGEWLFVGAPREDDGFSNAGAVYVFKNIAGEWTQVDRLKAPTPRQDDLFGESVSVSGDVAVIGTSLNDDQASGAGTAYVFEYDGADWQFKEQLFASDGSIGDRLAKSVAIYDDVIVAGADGEDGDMAEESAGAAYFFRRDPTATSLEETPYRAHTAFRTAVYPNPARERATFSLTLREPQYVQVGLYDLLGRRVGLLHQGELTAGVAHRFSLASPLPNGMYFIRVQGASGSAIRPILFVK
jgi:hypothetical protein